MAIRHSEVAESIQELMRKNGVDVVTFTWPDFYKVSGRERIKVEFQTDLAASLKALGLLINFGSTVVLVAKDFSFARIKLS
jgi:hypothetical protein